MNIVNLSPDAIHMLAEAATAAERDGRRLRVSFTEERKWYEGGQYHTYPATVSFKVGEGMWSPPYADQPDPYRDAPPGGTCTETDACKAVSHFLNCPK